MLKAKFGEDPKNLNENKTDVFRSNFTLMYSPSLPYPILSASSLRFSSMDTHWNQKIDGLIIHER